MSTSFSLPFSLLEASLFHRNSFVNGHAKDLGFKATVSATFSKI